MALGEMKTTRTGVSTAPEILYNSHFTGEAVTLATSAFTAGVCKAGTPIGMDGSIANTADAFGILLSDVYEERPQGTAVIGGYINAEKAQAHSGVTYTAAMAGALKNVVFIPAVSGGTDSGSNP